MKYIIYLLLFILTTSCATNQKTEFGGDRFIAEETNCGTIVKSFFKNEVTEEDINVALKERKLISLTDKLITVNYPKVDWIADTKKSLITRLKNWNKNKYPLFYLDSADDIVPMAKSYADLITKEAAGALDDEGKKSLEAIKGWISSYKNYQADLDNLLEERISLQYNINMLKEIKLEKNEVRDIKVTIKKDGQFKSEVITLRDEDRNLQFLISSYKDQIKELDGKVNSFGKIQERVIKQAMSRDVLTIFQRELEYSVKNTENAIPELTAHLDELESVLKDSAFEPSSYGVYKITNQVFKKELADLFNFSGKVKTVTNQNEVGIRGTIEKFFGRSSAKDKAETINQVKDAVIETATTIAKEVKDAATPATAADVKKPGPLQKIYSKIATFTPYQKLMATTKLAVVGYGAYRYFIFKKDPPKMVDVTTTTEVIPDQGAQPDQSSNAAEEKINKDHETQLAETAKLEQEKSDGNSSVVEIHLENLMRNTNKRPVTN